MAAKTKVDKSRAYTCGKCNKAGHNARSCPGEINSSDEKKYAQKKAPAKKKSSAAGVDTGQTAPESTAEEATNQETDFDTDGPSLPIAQRDDNDESETVEVGPPAGQVPPGAKIIIPKRKRSRSKAQEAFWSATEKKLAPNAVAEASELAMDIPRISTGNFGLDVALYGGVPQGRIVRFWGLPKSGKTGSCLNTVASYQKTHCSECYQRKCDCKDRDVPYVVWVDAENRMNSMLYWPESHGINLDCMKIMTPPTGQNVVDFVDHIIREEDTAKVGLIVVDSIAHIVSMDELNKPTLDGQTVGRSAYLMNQAWKRWTSAVHSLGIKNERKPTILCINQIRQKVGQMFGCFHGDTPVMFADGSQHSIRDVVQNELPGPVLSWDGNEIVERKITGWHNNGPLNETEKWLTFKTTGTGGARGAIGFTCTENHTLVSGEGREIPASEVREGDQLLSCYQSTISDEQRDLIVGSLLGDGHLHQIPSNKTTANLTLSNASQDAYLEWKLCQLSPLGFKRVDSGGRVSYKSKNSFELGLLRKWFYNSGENAYKNYKTIPSGTVSAATALTLAVWFMDDGFHKKSHRSGEISVSRLLPARAEAIARELQTRFGSERSSASGRKLRSGSASVSYRSGKIILSTPAFERFSDYIADYVHPSMAYKLLPEHQSRSRVVELATGGLTRVPHPVTVTRIHTSARKMRMKNRYDLTIEGNSFYIVGGDSSGCIVHNSNEIQPGGIGQDFATSIDVRFSSGPPTYVVWDEKKEKWVAKEKGFKSTFKPKPDQAPDFMKVNYRVTASGVCPSGRYGEFNYWLRAAHNHRCGDPDNGLQLWNYCKTYGLVEEEGQTKRLFGHEARTYDELMELFRTDTKAHEKAWKLLLQKLECRV